jgi:hypothetical protein
LFNDQDENNPQSWNLYTYVRNYPLLFIDPDGRSTHTDRDGYVVAVYDDGDLGVYQHDSAFFDLAKQASKSALADKGKGINRMGETENWDEFRDHDPRTGAVLDRVAAGARIMFGQSFDDDIQRLNEFAVANMNLRQIASNSRNGRTFDIKVNTTIAPFGPNTGKQLNGKYATAESAGNFLAGLNGATGTYKGAHFSLETVMKLAGSLQQGKWSEWNAAKIILFGTAYGPSPWYGEIEYSGRRIAEGYAYGSPTKIGPHRPGSGTRH